MLEVSFDIVKINGSGPLQEGDDFWLDVYVQDIRSTPTGVSQAYFDIRYDSSKITYKPELLVLRDRILESHQVYHGPEYDSFPSADLTNPSWIDEAGGLDGTPPASPAAKYLLFGVPFHAYADGSFQLELEMADAPGHHVELFTSVPPFAVLEREDIRLAGETIQIANGVNAPPINTVPGPQAVNEDQTLVLSNALGNGISIADDAGAEPVQVSLVGTNGAMTLSQMTGLSFSLGDGAGDAAMTFTGTIAAINAALNGMAFVPTSNYTGAAGIQITTDDLGHSGTGGPLSDTDQVAITVNPVNDAPVLAPISPSLTQITEDDTNNAGSAVSTIVGQSISDVDAGALEGMAVISTAITSGAGAWQYSINGGTLWQDVGSVSASQTLLLRPEDRLRFVPDGQNAATGTIGFVAWDQTGGSPGTKVDASVRGGTTPFSTATDTASISVTALNDAPVLTQSSPSLPSITEDETNNSGALVSAIAGAAISDVDAGALKGIAVTGASVTAGSGTWQYSTNGGAPWQDVGSVSASQALLLRPEDRLRFVPDGQNAATGTIGFVAWDQTGGSPGAKVDGSVRGGTAPFSTATDTASISVTALNDAPVLTPVSPVLAPITEDDTNPPGFLVSAIVGSDIDLGAVKGIALSGAAVASGGGLWQFSTTAGTTWQNVGAVSLTQSLLLRAEDRLRFIPDGKNEATAAVTYRAWDQTGTTAGQQGNKVSITALGSGGTSPFSEAEDTAAITATAVNDAPVLTPISPILTEITENQTDNVGNTVASLLGESMTDVDAGAVEGIAVTATAVTSGAGTWQFWIDGGTTWQNVGAVSLGQALLLRAEDKLRFVPDGQNAATATVTYRAWDQTGTTAGRQGTKADITSLSTSPFSTTGDTAGITVTAVNDAPVLTPISPSLASITEDQSINPGNIVSAIVGGSISDIDLDAAIGIAVTGAAVTSGNGAWQFSKNGGLTWQDVGTVSLTQALLLRAEDKLRFVPDGQNAATATVTYRAWDQTGATAGQEGAKVDIMASGTSSTSPFSTGADTAGIAAAAVNDAPVLTLISPSLASITEDQSGNPGDAVSAIIGGSISDVDLGAAAGIAVTGAAIPAGSGMWQFSTNAGVNWQNVETVSLTQALLLRAEDKLRFVPDVQNAASATVTYRAWDQTGATAGQQGTKVDISVLGTGGTSPFSTTVDTAGITVAAVNDAPVLAPKSPALTPLSEDDTDNPGDAVSAIVTGAISDVDAGAVQGIGVTSAAVTSGNGIWQFSTDGGTTWQNVGTVSLSQALLLRAEDRLRFVPDGVNGATASLTYRAWDRTGATAGQHGTKADITAIGAGGTSPFSTASDIAGITVAAVNNSPVLTPALPSLASIMEDQTGNAGNSVASIVSGSISDVDAAALQGIAVTAVAVNAGGGAWEFSIDGGTNWQGLGAVDPGQALLLRAEDRLRFVPDGMNAAAATVTYHAWDQTGTTAGKQGTKVDVTSTGTGGTSPFSTDVDTADIAVAGVNDAPVLAPVSPVLTAITEDETNNSGVLVSAVVGNSIADVDAGAVEGIAVTGATVTSGNGTWQFSTDNGGTWQDVGTVSLGQALLLRAEDKLRFVPDGHNAASAAVAYLAWDQSGPTAGQQGTKVDAASLGAGGTSPFSLAGDTAGIAVTAVNDAPVLASISPVLAAITEDETDNPGVLVSAMIGNSISDVDIGDQARIAVIEASVTSGNGVWQFSIDGGATWQNVGTVSLAQALLLDVDDRLRFVPDGKNGATATVAYHGCDQTGSFSDASDTAGITATALNDAPLLTPISPSLTQITENDTSNPGALVSQIVVESISDVDANAAEGIAVIDTAVTLGAGKWQYSTDGGTAWHDVATVSASQALLLRAEDKLRFVPDGQNAATATLAYRAWDQTSITAGGHGTKVDSAALGTGGASPFSLAQDTISITITAVNDAPVLTSAFPQIGQTDENSVGGWIALSSFINATAASTGIADVDAGATVGGIAVMSATGRGTWAYSLDGGSTALPVGDVSTESALLLPRIAHLRYTPDGENGETATIGYFAWDQTSGSAGAKVNADVRGGATPFSEAADTASMLVTSVNDAPVLSPASPEIGRTGGLRVEIALASFINAGPGMTQVADVDAAALMGGIAVIATSGNGTWEYSIDGGATYNPMGAVSDASALLLPQNARIAFTPAAIGEPISITYLAWDQTAGVPGTKRDTGLRGGTTAFSAASDQGSILLNRAPELVPAAPQIAAINEETPTGWIALSSFINAAAGSTVLTDADPGALVGGIAITGVTGSGIWAYSFDGGATAASIETVSVTSALLLPAGAVLHYVPDHENGETATITYAAWDRTKGTAGTTLDASMRGGTTALSEALDTATIPVTGLNDAPRLTPTAPRIARTDGARVEIALSSFINAAPSTTQILDVDAAALVGGIAVIAASGNGTWEYSIDGGATYSPMGVATDASALLLPAYARVAFTTAGFDQLVSLRYLAWDQTVGGPGTKADASNRGGETGFSNTFDTASILLNRAPVLAPATPQIATTNEDTPSGWIPLTGFINAVAGATGITDVDAGALVGGIAVTGATGNGVWSYSLDGGTTSGSVGEVSNGAALLLPPSAHLRYSPDGENGETATITYVAWDQTDGDAGTKVDVGARGEETAFSQASDTGRLVVTAVNDAPDLTPITPTLAQISEDQADNPGQTVSSILGASVSDVDAVALEGIAVTSVSGAGKWQYSTNGGGAWHDVGAVSGQQALLVRPEDKVRFVPDGENATTATVTYRAWDQTGTTAGQHGTKVDLTGLGTGGTSPFSAAVDTAGITVTAVNDAPLVTQISPVLTQITEDNTGNAGDAVSSIVGNSLSDVDADAVEGIAVIVTTVTSGNGTWQYSTDGGGAWQNVGVVSTTQALLLRPQDRLRFVPNSENAATAAVTYLAWDQTGATAGGQGTKVDLTSLGTGGATPFSTDGDTATILATAVNDAPVLTRISPALTQITEDDTGNPGDTVASIVAGSIIDVDDGAVEGIAVIGTAVTSGKWQYSTDAGGTWQEIGTVSLSQALLLRAEDRLRFVPDGENGATAAVTYHAWDQTGTTAGQQGTRVNLATLGAGGTTAFSTAADTASVLATEGNDAPVLVPVSPELIEITEDATGNLGAAVSSIVGESISDIDTAAAEGIAVTGVAVTSGTGKWQYSLNGSSTWQDVGTVSATQALLLRAEDRLRFVPDAQNVAAATLTYYAWDQTGTTAGQQGTKANVDSLGRGGAAPFSIATDVASIAVTAVNDAPVLTPLSPSLPQINEDDTDNAGQAVSAVVGSSIGDVDASAVKGIAVTGVAVTSGTGKWQYSIDGSGVWQDVGTVSATQALLLRAEDKLRFVPDGQNAAAASATYRAWDQTGTTAGGQGTKVSVTSLGTGGTSPFSEDTDAVSITASAVNDAPVLVLATPALTQITEDAVDNTGDAVSAFAGNSISDVDTGAVEGIAVTGALVTSGAGKWQYSINGGGVWQDVGPASASQALLLRAEDRLRFVPDGQNVATGTVTYRAWDQTATTAGGQGTKVDVDALGTGGATPFSTAADTTSITVSAINDAPVLTPVALVLPPISEDDIGNPGYAVSAIIGESVSDIDTAAVEGIAVIGAGVTAGAGSWRYSTDGGATWQDVGTVSVTQALLLRAENRLRFVPDGQNAASATLTYCAWDQTGTTAGQQGTKANVDSLGRGGAAPFSIATDVASIAVTAVNDAPVLTPLSPTLPQLSEDDTSNPGQTVSAIVGSSIADVDPGAVAGIAVAGAAVASGAGKWQYSTDGDGIWQDVGAVSENQALLLRAEDKLRFLPDAQNAAAASVTYRAWDQTGTTAGGQGTKVNVTGLGSGGASPFSAATDIAGIVVAAVNDAPVLTPASPPLAQITEDATDNSGSAVSAFAGDSSSDIDTGALEGIAVTGITVTSGTGKWQYSINGGSIWQDVGTISAAQALLLRAEDKLRFVPDGQKTAAATVTYRAWDQTGTTAGGQGSKVNIDNLGTGGTTPFSTATDTASITVTAVNDAPVLTPLSPALTQITEDSTDSAGQAVSAILGNSVSDVDAAAVEGIALTSAAVTSGAGKWQYSINGGSTWQDVGTVSATQALLLRADDKLRFVPDGQNAAAASVTYRAWDQTGTTAGGQGTKVSVTALGTGGTSPFSAVTDTAGIVVTAVNDAPVITAASPALTQITEDAADNSGDAVSAFAGATISDIDTGAVEGIAVTGVAVTSGAGKWQYSINGGSTWQDVGIVSASQALLLRAQDKLRFVPDGQNAATATVTYRAWDQTGTTAGGQGTKVNSDSLGTGGTTSFSAAANTASITVTAVNDAPVLEPISPGLAQITEDSTNHPGDAVSAIVGGSISDVDTSAVEGIAVTGVAVTSGAGKWQYSINGGSTWQDVGIVSASQALLLRAQDKLRFVPDGQNAATATVTYRAWDQTGTTAGGQGTKVSVTSLGTGGSAPFSAASDTAHVAATAVNDAPVLAPISPTLPPITANTADNPGDLVSAIVGDSLSDVDANGVEGIAVTGASAGSSTGKWQFSINAGAAWQDVGTVGATEALLLRPQDKLRFVPAGASAATASVTYRAWDQTGTTAGGQGTKVSVASLSTGGSAPFSEATDTATIRVGHGSLAGYVYVDGNNDGVRALASSGEPIEFGLSQVTLTLRKKNEQTGAYADVPGKTVTTGPDGFYWFDDLPAGIYEIVQTQPERFMDGIEKAGSLGGTAQDNRITEIRLGSGENGRDYNFCERGLKLEYIGLSLFLGSTPPASEVACYELGLKPISIKGTSGSDRIVFTPGTDSHTVVVNDGQPQVFPVNGAHLFMIDAGDGDDEVVLNGSTSGAADAADLAWLSTYYGNLRGKNYMVQATGAEKLSIDGKGGGSDYGLIHDSPSQDHLLVGGNKATLTAAENLAELIAFQRVHAISQSGGNDTVKKETIDFVLSMEGDWTEQE